jgi:hypothetical protein
VSDLRVKKQLVFPVMQVDVEHRKAGHDVCATVVPRYSLSGGTLRVARHQTDMNRTRHSLIRTALQLLPFMLWFGVTALGAQQSSGPAEHGLLVFGLTVVMFVSVVLLVAAARLRRAPH